MSDLGETDLAEGSKKKPRKHKLFDYRNTVSNDDASPEPEVHVKTEQDSDQSTSYKKSKKSKHKHKLSMKLEKNGTDDEDFLNIKVKEEESKLKLLEECTPIKQELMKSDDNSDINRKHKKAKKKKHNSYNQSVGEDKVNIKQHNFSLNGSEKEDQVKVKHKKKNKKADHEEMSQDEDVSHVSHLEQNNSQTESQNKDDSFNDTNHKSKKKKHKKSHEEFKVFNGMEIDDHFSAEETVIKTPKKRKDSSKNKKLSEQIVFEDEIEEPNISNSNSVPSPSAVPVEPGRDRGQAEERLEQYVRSLGAGWGRAGGAAGGQVEGAEEVWVVSAARGAAAGARSVELHAHGARLKGAAGRLHGALVHEHTACVLLAEGKEGTGGSLRLLPLQGSVRFHHKLPEPGAAEPLPAPDPQPACIPLPDTKTRHPLFGADYTQSIHLPHAVAEKLHRATIHKKKSKKAKRIDRIETTNVEVVEELDHAKDEKSKKKKKRKLSVASEEVVGVGSGEWEVTEPKRKKKKHRADNNGDLWHSARHMEETLFNF